MPDDVATPLSDAEFVRVMHDAIVNRDGETIEELAEDARYHRAQLAEARTEIVALNLEIAQLRTKDLEPPVEEHNGIVST